MKLVSRKLSLYRTIYILFCLTGCLWHISSISSVYLEYETDVNVVMNTNSLIYIPMITICYQLRNILLPKVNWTQRIYTPKALNDITYNAKDLLKWCSPRYGVVTEYGNYTNCLNLELWGFKIETHINQNIKCLTVIDPQLNTVVHRYSEYSL